MRRLMEPRSVAIIGASSDARKFSGRPIAYMAQLGYRGAVYPINPGATSIQGFPCFPDIAAVPGPVDAAIIARPAAEVLPAVKQCLAQGIRAFVVFSAGFAERGIEGRVLQDRLAETCRSAGAVLCGPNGTGLFHVPSRATLSFMSNLDQEMTDGGSVALVSNSGSIAAMVYQGHGAVFNAVVSGGNEAVLSSADYIAYAAEDPDTCGIVAFIEGIRDAAGLVGALRRAAALDKPVAILKGGRSADAAAVATSHTGALIDDDSVLDAVFHDLNVIRVRTIEELKAIAVAMHGSRGRRLGRGIGVVTPSGGTAVLLADEILDQGLDLVVLAPATQEAIQAIVPETTARNPVDVTGFGAEGPAFGRIAAVVAADPAIDVLLAPMGGAVGPTAQSRGEALIALAQHSPKTIVPIWQSTTRDQPGYDQLKASGLPVFTDYAAATLAFGRLVGYRLRGERRPSTEGWMLPAEARAMAESAGLRGCALNEIEAKALFAAAGIAVPRGARLAASGGVPVPSGIRFPAVLKVVSRDVAHKSAIGGVAVLHAAGELADALETMRASVSRHVATQAVEAYLLEEMILGGTELLVGVKSDPRFGRTISLGIGGTLANAFKGAATAMLPLDRDRAAELVRRFSPSLAGGGIEAALADLLLRVGALGEALGERIDVLEINPIKLLVKGADIHVFALDGVIAFRAPQA